MGTQVIFNSVLVPVDFSDPSRLALENAMALVGGENPGIIVMHVIDEALIELVLENSLGEKEELLSRLRNQAENRLGDFTQVADTGVELTRIVSVGKPFVEIIRKSKDFAVDAIVMSKVGAHGRFENLLFGSTAERVIREACDPCLLSLGQAVRSERYAFCHRLVEYAHVLVMMGA